MARHIGPKQRLQRQIGEDLNLKSNALKTAKRITVRPGQHGHKGRKKLSEFGQQLKEKQKLKYIYGLLEKQLKKIFEKASRDPLSTGSVALSMLERRLDNVIYRLGFTPTRAAARQLVSHNHVKVNNKRMNIPSYQVKKDDVINLDNKAVKIPYIAELIKDKTKGSDIPVWLERKAAVARVLRFPNREDIQEKIDEQLVVEFYSR